MQLAQFASAFPVKLATLLSTLTGGASLLIGAKSTALAIPTPP